MRPSPTFFRCLAEAALSCVLLHACGSAAPVAEEPETEAVAAEGSEDAASPGAMRLSLGQTSTSHAGASASRVVIEQAVWELECGDECTPDDALPRVPSAVFDAEVEAGSYVVMIQSTGEAPETCNGWSIEGVSREPFDGVELASADRERRRLRRTIVGDWACSVDGVQAWHLAMPESGPVHFAVTENHPVPRPDAERTEGVCGGFRIVLVAAADDGCPTQFEPLHDPA